MTDRLTERSKDLNTKLVKVVQQGNDIFIEWEMTISYKKYSSSILYGFSRLTLNEQGKLLSNEIIMICGEIYLITSRHSEKDTENS